MTTDASEATVTPEDTPIQRPRTIDIAAAATVVRAVLWIATAFLYDPNRNKLFAIARDYADKADKKAGKPLRPDSDVWNSVASTHDALKLGIPLALILLVLAKFVRDGKSWAKWLIVITAVLTGDIFKTFNFVGPLPMSLKIGYVALGLATVVSIVFMFVRDSGAYFRAVSPSMSLFRTAPARDVPGVEEVGDTDVSTAIRRKPPRAKSRKAPEEK